MAGTVNGKKTPRQTAPQSDGKRAAFAETVDAGRGLATKPTPSSN
jgi:hypothetical protein